MKILILCDFDGTIRTQDVGDTLLKRFSSGEWEAIAPAFRSFYAFCTDGASI